MDQIATLGITVQADGAIRQVQSLDTSLQKLSSTAEHGTKGMGALDAMHKEITDHVGEHSLAIGRLEMSLARFGEHALGINSTVGILGASLSKFAVGSIETAGILLAADGLIAVYDKLTEAARKATQENEKLTQSLAGKFLPKTGPRSSTNLDYEGARRQQADASQQLKALMADSGGPLGRDQSAIDTQTERLRQANVAIADAFAGSVSTMKTVTVQARNVNGEAAKLAEALAVYEGVMEQFYAKLGGQSPTRAQKASSLAAQRGLGLNDKEQTAFNDSIGKPMEADIKNSASYAVSEAVQMYRDTTGKQLADAEKHTARLERAVGRAAETTAILLGNLLGGLIGNSTGSRTGAALLGGIGGAVGGMFEFAGGGLGAAIGTAALPVIGTVAGALVGSLIGGLFGSHKKAVNANTAALNALNATILNGPAGYKLAGARYRADDGRQIYAATATEMYNRKLRGGVGNMGMAA